MPHPSVRKVGRFGSLRLDRTLQVLDSARGKGLPVEGNRQVESPGKRGSEAQKGVAPISEPLAAGPQGGATLELQHSRGTISAGTALSLQRSAGNRVVSALLTGGMTIQRAGEESAPGHSHPVAPPAPASNPKAKARWGRISGAVDESRQFNKGMRGTAVMDKMRAGVRAEKEAQFGVAEGPEPKPRSADTTHTAGGAWLANQMGRKDMIGDVEEYIPFSERSKHLEQFLTGAHAFITPQVHKNIHNLNEDPKSNWGGWGADYNFVAPLSKADKLVEAAAAPGAGGIFDLEKALGVPRGQWVKQCAPDYVIYRYKILDPQALNVRIPSGRERNAYGSWWKGDEFVKGEWNPGGQTSGGASEAVIDKISLDKLQTLGKDVLNIMPDDSMAENTRRILAEEAGGHPLAAASGAGVAAPAAPAATSHPLPTPASPG